MFQSYSKTSEYFLRDYVAKAMVIMLSSCVKISCLRGKAHLVFHWCLYNKKVLLYSIIQVYLPRLSGLTVSGLDSGSSSPGLRPGQGHCVLCS